MSMIIADPDDDKRLVGLIRVGTYGVHLQPPLWFSPSPPPASLPYEIERLSYHL